MQVVSNKPLNMTELSVEEMNTEIEKGYADACTGNTKSAKMVFDEIRTDMGKKNLPELIVIDYTKFQTESR